MRLVRIACRETAWEPRLALRFHERTLGGWFVRGEHGELLHWGTVQQAVAYVQKHWPGTAVWWGVTL